MRLAIETFTGSKWMAGTVTIRDLIIALHKLGDERPILELVEWWGASEEDFADYRPYVDGAIRPAFPKSPRTRTPQPIQPLEKARETYYTRTRRFLTQSAPLPPLPPPPPRRDEFMRRLGIDCVLSVALENRTDVSTPLLVLIYDLQHHHFPELLDQAERERRDRVIRLEAERATRILVMSQSVRDDLATFLPHCEDKIRVFHFVSDIPSSVYDADLGSVLAKYKLPPEFIYLPNQFWQHKNHLGVIQALEKLGKDGEFPIVVCTGSITDHRNPDYIARVRSEIQRTGLQTQFLILGSVPRHDVFALMRQSVVVMNPSIFEGFGLSTAEAKSLGKRTLLADLPSLREQTPPNAVYFDPNNNDELVERIRETWLSRVPGADLECEGAARTALATRQREFAIEFMNIARDAIVSFKSQNEPGPTF